ncbi:MAG TPA: hypothetical protein DCL95_16155 [Rhodospirillaceae bacterium]|jgi:transcriptional regulator with XRE-family HTH domain|nr:hypothetical protein [Rhodospirillaceae bacterium]MAX64075.1 hypothetical protein [Rhodospirillaceae bacterium]MBB57333.1 hypothetical protein [Rhodospirillaceae bacterium]HAE00579.1 hypothetical protein [Rhodospirillaceae bacterium]HAJ21567.1 hypothetical protein [Rhodospirillaceae bacterium]|tara:strand:+ start:1176 stop:1856 length:681 start_codon:yes stop_codon:yes gene_type:complete
MIMKSEHTEIGHRQVEVRKQLGLTQADMADQLGIPIRTLSDNERGISISGGKVLTAYAELGISVDWLLTGYGKPFREDAPRNIRNLIEAADGGHIALAHFHRNDIRSSYLVSAEERRDLSRISMTHEMSAILCGTDDLGLPDAFRLFTIAEGDNRLLIGDARFDAVLQSGQYIFVADKTLNPYHIQALPEDRLAIMSATDPTRVDDVRNTSDLTPIARIVGSLLML